MESNFLIAIVNEILMIFIAATENHNSISLHITILGYSILIVH